MKRLALLLLLGGLALAQNQPQGQPQPGSSPFVDVPPCHWARGAVEAISSPAQAARPQPSALLAVNAVRQVFEGLKCGDPAWSERFIQGPFVGFGRTEARLSDFALENLQGQVSGNQAAVRFNLRAVLSTGTVSRSGTARLVFTETGWKVEYASLAALNLPVFPR